MRPDNKTIFSLSSLSGTHDGQIILEWFQNEQNNITMQLMHESSADTLRQLQGSAQTLQGIIDNFKNARQLANKINQ